MADHQPQFDIVPQMINLCATKGFKKGEQADRQALANALFSIITPYVGAHPAIAAHWLAALHKKSPLTRPVTTAVLMQQDLRNHSRISAEQGMILSASVLNVTRPGSGIDRIAREAFRDAFSVAMRHDDKAVRIPAIALRAAAQVCDDRVDVLKAIIRQGVMQVHHRLNA